MGSIAALRDECQHGHLARQCEICWRDARIAELEDALDTLRMHAHKDITEHWVLVPAVEWDAVMNQIGME